MDPNGPIGPYTLTLGKVDYHGTGRRVNAVDITYGVSHSGRFSMTGTVWNGSHTDVAAHGQIADVITGYFPADERVRSMVEIWDRWHLNDMRAGSPAQEAWLRAHPEVGDTWSGTIAALTAAGLHPDPRHLVSGWPYHYGACWLREALPLCVRAKIASWTVP